MQQIPMQMPVSMPLMPSFLPGIKVERRPNRAPPTIPQSCLYVRNLNEKLKVETLKKGLEAVFGSFGNIIDIKCKRNLKHRGQAFVSFENKEDAIKALNQAQGFPLFEKPMDIQFALEPSYAISALEGGEEAVTEHKKRRLVEQAEKLSKLAADATNEDEDQPSKKQKRGTGYDVADQSLPPNPILFIQNLPVGTLQVQLVQMFQQFAGFKEVRLVPGKADIAFVEYETEMGSAVAKQSLHGYRLGDREMKVTFAKR